MWIDHAAIFTLMSAASKISHPLAYPSPSFPSALAHEVATVPSQIRPPYSCRLPSFGQAVARSYPSPKSHSWRPARVCCPYFRLAQDGGSDQCAARKTAAPAGVFSPADSSSVHLTTGVNRAHPLLLARSASITDTLTGKAR